MVEFKCHCSVKALFLKLGRDDLTDKPRIYFAYDCICKWVVVITANRVLEQFWVAEKKAEECLVKAMPLLLVYNNVGSVICALVIIENYPIGKYLVRANPNSGG